MLYLLLFDHYEDLKGEDKDMSYYNEDQDIDFSVEQAAAAAESRKQLAGLPPGHPVFVRKGAELIAAQPGSKEAGFKRIGGPDLVKI